ncbi:hypothetical protein EJ06DRAFT_546681 [Trichodelitschia bisporula]|uniref:RanBD1 domain-containing protein n=1 Tax=Trichodelitschia bisporula TaxID=703511 RepID=A0A6G1I604_9PEZI|nr:hypothetical protein EJ06DRAFT_546681 [Trichodelitschia bisporula]
MRSESPEPAAGSEVARKDIQRTSPSSAGSGSDNESKPVRQKLEETTIAGRNAGDQTHKSNGSGSATGSESGVEKPEPGRLRKKRSIDEVDGKEEAGHPEKHVRKRSRDSPLTDDDEVMQAGTPERVETGEVPNGLKSPKGKRGIDEVQDGETEKKEIKRQKDVAQESRNKNDKDEENVTTNKIPPSSGFANSSAISPFASLASTSSPKPQTSASAFAASGFGALASSSSPFGALAGKKSPSPFGGFGGTSSFGKPATEGTSTTSTSVFGGALGSKSAFSTTGSAFSSSSGSAFGGSSGGAFGGSFLSAKLTGEKLSTFGSGDKIEGLSSKPAKPFGAAEDESEEEETDDDEAKEAEEESKKEEPKKAVEDGKRDKRFVEQHIETGEEGEETLFTARARLYSFIDREWKERGAGMMKLNTREVVVEDDKVDEATPRKVVKARFVMRAEGSHRLILNSQIIPETNYGETTGAKPKGGTGSFLGTLEGPRLQPLLFRMRPEMNAKLWEVFQEVKKEL